jgi:hypothetical protein
VFVDGTEVATVSTHATSPHYRRILFAKAWTVSGTHTISIVVVGSAGRPRVDVDALIVIR